VTPYKKTILLDDELGRGFPAVVQCGPYLFVSGADGHRDLNTHQIVPELAGKPLEQSRNSYGRARQRLEQAGFGGDRAVWIQHFTSGQEWRLQRMALWPEYFGHIEHGLAVSFGAQARMSGLNMMTTVVMALTPDVERTSVVPPPTPGRASRVTMAGAFVYVIGVRGHDHPSTGAVAAEETAGAFDQQAENCLAWLDAHVQQAGARLEDYLRIDSAIRNINQAGTFQGLAARRFGGQRPYAGYVVGMPMGARLEQEVGGLAVAPGERKEVAWRQQEPNTVAEAVKAGGLIFASEIRGDVDRRTGRRVADLCGDREAQTRRAFERLEAGLGRFEASLGDVLRLDVFLRDIYFEDQFLHQARDVFGANAPTMTIVGADLQNGAEIELEAIAAAPDGASTSGQGGAR
jgi:enamine deaminase RidA (YjgF/YER057c/UK114 family)